MIMIIVGQFAMVLLIMMSPVWSNSVPVVEKQNQTLIERRPICDVCICDDTNKLIDCKDQKFSKNIFSEEQWLNDTKIESVRKLSLCGNEIEHISPHSFRRMIDLEELDLSHNRLTFQSLRPDVFEGKYQPTSYEPLSKLKTLNLANNRLHELDPDVFEHLPALESLTLSGNYFHEIANGANSAISRLPKLQFLDLSYMELDNLPEHMLHSLKQLRHIRLTGNLFAKLPSALGYAEKLESLNMDENPLQNLSDANVFPPMSSLQSLSLSYIMPMQSIGKGALSQLVNLTSFNCSNNPRLVEIHRQAFSRSAPILTNDENVSNANTAESWPPIAELRMHNNNLHRLDAHLLARWDSLRTLEVHTNPWRCDCENQWVLDVLVPLLVNRSGFNSHHMLCEEPAELIGQELAVLHQHRTKLDCIDGKSNDYRQTTGGAIWLGVMIGMICGMTVVCMGILVYRRGHLCGASGPNNGAAAYSRAFYKRAEMRDTDLRVHT